MEQIMGQNALQLSAKQRRATAKSAILRKFAVVASILVLLPPLTGCDILLMKFSGSGKTTEIAVQNASFETGTGSGTDWLPANWVKGGTWAGEWSWAPCLIDGERASWSSFQEGGDENGFSQELTATVMEGTYVLTVWAGGDSASGLTSRIILGYDNGGNSYTELSHQDDVVCYDGLWRKQVLTLDIPSGSTAIGKNLWIRLTGTTVGIGGRGNSNWWDHVSLYHVDDHTTSKSSDNTLSSISIWYGTTAEAHAGITFTPLPGFTAATTSYSLTVPATTEIFAMREVTNNIRAAVKEDFDRLLSIGLNILTLHVIAEDGTLKDYIITVNREAD